MNYTPILDNVKEKMHKSDVVKSEFGDDWLAYVNHVYSRNISEFFKMHVDELIGDEIKNLPEQARCELWQLAISDELYIDSYLKELNIKTYSGDFYKFYNRDKISEFLSTKLSALADKDFHLLEKEGYGYYDLEADLHELAERGERDQHEEDDDNKDREEGSENLRAILTQMQESINTAIADDDGEIVHFARRMDDYLKRVLKLLG